MASRSLEFSNLPLQEVALKVFLKEPKLELPHYVAAWLQLRQDYCEILEAAGVELSVTGQATMKGLPGVVFKSAKYTLTAQSNLVITRWDRSLGSPYPRYAALREALLNGLGALQTAAAAVDLGIYAANITYTNIVVPPSDDPMSYFRELMVNGVIPVPAIGMPLHDLNVSWNHEPLGVDFRLMIQRWPLGNRGAIAEGGPRHETQTAFTLTTVAGCTHNASAGLPADLDRLHGALQDFFASIITDRARTDWGFTDV